MALGYGDMQLLPQPLNMVIQVSATAVYHLVLALS